MNCKTLISSAKISIPNKLSFIYYIIKEGREGVAFQCQELRDFLRSDQYEIDHQPLKSNVALMSKVWSSECI